MSDVEIIERPTEGFGLDSITRAEIDVAIATAKRWPRSIATFKDEVRAIALLDAETAASCYYSLRRQGKTIQGPSIRLAEIAANAWGNIRCGARILGETEDGKFVAAIGVCHDLQKNVQIAMECRRRITRSNGEKYGDDMIGVTANAAAGVAFRNAVLKVVPRALVGPIYEECKKVAAGDAKTLREKRENVFERLAGLNPLLNAERILASLGKPSLDDVTLDDVAHLIGLGTGIKDGETPIDEAFPEIATEGPDTTPVQPPALTEPPDPLPRNAEKLSNDDRRHHLKAIRKADK